MKRLRWLTVPAIIAIQEELITHYGGVSGVRSRELLESAVARPKHVATYKKRATIPDLAAAYAWGLLRNHPFIDGNKRVALAAAVVFLELNGWDLSCSEVEETAMILSAAAGQITENEWTRWIRHVARKTG